MKALCWEGVDKLDVQRVPDPQIVNDQDAIVKVTLSTTCGSDLHLINGFVPTMRPGDVMGHEFMGEIVEAGPGVRHRRVGDRVVVCSFIGCGRCWYCTHDQWSLCDNSNPNWELAQEVFGFELGGVYAYSHALGGFKGSHAEYIRVPFADYGTFLVPDDVDDLDALFASDAAPTGWMGADLGGVQPGDVVAVWGAGGVGQMAARAAELLGAEQVIVIDRLPERLAMTERHTGAETIDFSTTDVDAELRERTGGRGPDVCIEAVGMEAVGGNGQHAAEKIRRRLGRPQERPIALRQAIHACRKGGSVFILGVFGGSVDRFPLGAVMNKGMTVRGAQQHGHRYIPMLLERIAAGELSTSHLATHEFSLEGAPKGYQMFKNKQDGCVRAVFRPHG
ncbi:Threonine dehydrogenase [Thermomonospora echinospora]|uniref:Threonine dehydrogenase n=1 Tax=Thermomonospora echinospora TaxID=1992 RepID=A0A1H6D9M0_9ACTN|nr:zinc-dependent alcohol dehydrogenase [Thermomonospora echinospora]SEG81970.1 Threonine dehydrogenase [Thermomonospora echinospora]